ncbi:MAG: hypothetical protein LC721_11845 [Actinobacteria bacterium]|nr:hypothetical protein [Actinomycetota bacterium]
MTELANINFVDRDSGEGGLAVVRVERDVVSLALSLNGDGDIEVFLGARELGELLATLTTAHAMIEERGVSARPGVDLPTGD